MDRILLDIVCILSKLINVWVMETIAHFMKIQKYRNSRHEVRVSIIKGSITNAGPNSQNEAISFRCHTNGP